MVVGMWQPIETAPKDGSRVLLFGKERGFLDARAFVGAWLNERWMGPQIVAIPTHWMPLPTPPSPM